MPPRSTVTEQRRVVANDEIVQLIPALRAFARALCRNECDADDLVQETLIKAIAKIEQFTPGTSLRSWLFTIMRNTFYTKLRLARRESTGSADCISSSPAVNPTQEWSSRGRELNEALQRLPQTQREILMLIGVLGVSYLEAADMYGCAVGTIKSRLNRARQRLLEELGEDSVGASVETVSYFPVGSLNR
jgi:RNA polymerase sigma factor (sigma-70 family)